MIGDRKRGAKTRCQCLEIPVYCPWQSVRCHQDGSKQRNVDRTATIVVQPLVLDERQHLFRRRDLCLPKHLEVAQCPLAGSRGRTARQFEHDQRMTKNTIILEQ